jgi:hypothetical protein
MSLINGKFLAYCTNIHPGEHYQDLVHVLNEDLRQVKECLKSEIQLGLGLRIGAQTLAEIKQNQAHFLNLLNQNQECVFTLNGFPYGNFAQKGLKEGVYLPSWAQESRRAYTLALAELLVQCPGPKRRSISTLSGGFINRTEGQKEIRERQKQYSQMLTKLAIDLEKLEQQHGVQIQIAIEPEPWTTLEDIDGVIDFFNESLYPMASINQRYLGLCYDCCHQSVMFEDAINNLKKLEVNQIPIVKMQVSNALAIILKGESTERKRQKIEALLAFEEEVYLHQSCGLQRLNSKECKLLKALDLGLLREELKVNSAWYEADEWRCHFHVPLFWAGNTLLSSTMGEWQKAVQYAKEEGLCDQFEVETYTWHVLPDEVKAQRSIHQGIAQELDLLYGLLHQDQD